MPMIQINIHCDKKELSLLKNHEPNKYPSYLLAGDIIFIKN